MLDALIADAEFLAADSDTRFGRVFEMLGAEPAKRKPKAQEWKNPQGKKAARIERDDVQTRIVFDERQVPEFGSYLADRLDDLYAEFTASLKQGGRHQLTPGASCGCLKINRYRRIGTREKSAKKKAPEMHSGSPSRLFGD